MAGPLQGREFGQDIGGAARRFVNDRRDDERYAIEQKQMGLQEEGVEAKSADLSRQQETARYDKDYEMYKREMGRGIQQFAMDGANYQDAIDTSNQFYGSDMRVTHRKDSAGNITYDFSGNDKNGDPIEQYGKTREDLGAMLNMSMNPVSWLEKYEETNIARNVASASAAHDIDKIDRKGMWDSINAKIKAGGDAATTGLKFQKQAWTMAASEFGTLGEDGTFTFGDTYGADYAANTAHYAATLAQHGGKKFKNDITSANQHALTKVKSLKKVYEKKIKAENPEMEEEEQNLLVKLYVDGEVRRLTDDVTTKGAASAATDEDRQQVVTDNSDTLHQQMRDADIPEAEIEKVITENGGEYDGGVEVAPDATPKAGLTEDTPAEDFNMTAPENMIDTEGLKAPELNIDETIDDATPKGENKEEPQKLESLAQKGDVGLVDQPVDFGSRKKEADPNKESKSIAKSSRSSRSDKGMTKDIEKARKQSPGGKATQRLINARKDAAERVEESFAGGGKVTSRKILEAALRSGDLKESTAAAVRQALGQTDTTMVAGQ